MRGSVSIRAASLVQACHGVLVIDSALEVLIPGLGQDRIPAAALAVITNFSSEHSQVETLYDGQIFGDAKAKPGLFSVILDVNCRILGPLSFQVASWNDAEARKWMADKTLIPPTIQIAPTPKAGTRLF